MACKTINAACAGVGRQLTLFTAIALWASASYAVDRIKEENTDNLNLPSSWVGGMVPGSTDLARWNSTVTGPNTVELGANLTWGGLRIENPGGDVAIGGGNSLTLGSAGLDVGSSANLTFNNTGNLTLNGPLSGSTTLMLDSNATKNWAAGGGMTVVSFTGTLVLRGGTGASGGFSGNWLAFGPATLSQTGTFHLDTGESLTNRGEFVITDGWGDGATKPKLTLASLTGYGDFRSDWGANTYRTLLVHQATDTTYSGRLVTSSSSRGIDLEKSGAGTLTLTGANTNRNTTVTAGILEVGNGGTTGAAGLGAISVAGGAELIFNRSNGFTVSNMVSGAGLITKKGGGRMTVNGNNSAGALNWNFTGAGNGDIGFSNANALGGSGSTITLAANATGSTFLGSNGNTSDVAISIGSGANFTWNGSTGNTNTLSGEISGDGAFTKVSGETLILTGANSHQDTILSAGKLQIGNGGATGNIGRGSVSIAPGATLEFNRTGLLDYKVDARMRNVSGAGDVVLTGGVKMFNFTGTGTGFNEPNSWNGFSGKLIIKGGSEFQTIRHGRTAMGTAQVILGDATSSGTLSQNDGNWVWTNNIELVGSANEILNNTAGGTNRWNKIQGVLSGGGNVTFRDTTGAFGDGTRGFILTGQNILTGTLTVDTFVRIGGVGGDSTGLGGGNSGTLGSASVVVNEDKRLTFSRTDTHTVSNSISGPGSVYIGSTGIAGTAAQVVMYTGTADYTGPTVVDTGALIVNGVLSNTAVTVASGATLGGGGAIAGPVNIAGTLSPGASIGSLGVGAVALNHGSTFAYEFNTSTAEADLLYSNGSLSLSGTVALNLVDEVASTELPLGTKLSLISYDGDWNGGLFTYEGSSLEDDLRFDLGANTWWFRYADSTGGSNFAADQAEGLRFVTMTVIPEPGTVILLTAGLLALLGTRRRPG